MVETSIQVVSPLSGTGAAVQPPQRRLGGGSGGFLGEGRDRAQRAEGERPRSAVRAAVLKLVGMFIEISMEWELARSERVGVGFAGADAHGVIERKDEDLSVADLSCLGGADDRFDGLVDDVGG